MPKINVYLPNELAQAVKEAGVPVSAVCQRALARAVERTKATRIASSGDLAATELATHLQSNSLVVALTAATGLARAQNSPCVGTAHLLRGLLASGERRVLHAMGIDREELERELADWPVAEPVVPGVDRPEQLSVPASSAVALAAAEAQASGGDIGRDYLLLGLIAEQDGVAGKALRAQGAKLSSARQAIANPLAAAARPGGRQEAGSASGSAVDSVLRAAVGALVDELATAIQEQIEPLAERIERLERQTDIIPGPPVPGRPAA
jgi:ATP-dependent Clp protease ATP-binding subunit ClpC